MTKTLTPSMMSSRPPLRYGHSGPAQNSEHLVERRRQQPGRASLGHAAPEDGNAAEETVDALIEIAQELRQVGSEVLHLAR